MEYTELASKIRSKYPGAYDDLDDTALAQKIVSKYPQYSDTTFSTSQQDQSSGLAESAVSAITPEVQGPPPKEPFLQRLARGTRQMFLPKDMGEVKALFNPNAGQYGLPRILEEEGKRVGSAVRGAAMNSAEQLATSKFGQKNPGLAAGLGAGYSTVADVASDQLTPSAFQQQMGGEGSGLFGRVALEGGIVPVAKKVAQGAGRRALGFIKSQLKKTRGGVERANAVAQEALDKGVITPMASADEMLPRAQALSGAGKADAVDVIQTLDKSGVRPDIDATALAEKVESELRQALGKNAPQGDLTAIKEIKARIAGYGKKQEATFNYATLKDNPPPPSTYTFDDIQKLKEVLQEPSKAKWTTQTDAVKADLYRRASGIVNAELRKAVGKAGRGLPGGEGLLNKYLEGNLTAGKGAEAARALEDRALREAGNNFIDPFTGAVGLAGAGYSLYQQDPGAAAATLAAVGLRKFGRSYGAQITAKGADIVSKGAARAGSSLANTRPGFLASLQASARRELGKRSPGESKPNGDGLSFLASASKRAGERVLSASMPPAASAQAFNRIMSEGSPQSMNEVDEIIRRKAPKIYEAAKKAGTTARRLLQDALTLQGSPEAMEELVRDITAKRKQSANAR